MEWELTRYENIQDRNRVIIMATCNSCERYYPIQMDIFDLLQKHKGIGINEIIVEAKVECRECGGIGMRATIAHR